MDTKAGNSTMGEGDKSCVLHGHMYNIHVHVFSEPLVRGVYLTSG